MSQRKTNKNYKSHEERSYSSRGILQNPVRSSRAKTVLVTRKIGRE